MNLTSTAGHTVTLLNVNSLKLELVGERLDCDCGWSIRVHGLLQLLRADDHVAAHRFAAVAS